MQFIVEIDFYFLKESIICFCMNKSIQLILGRTLTLFLRLALQFDGCAGNKKVNERREK